MQDRGVNRYIFLRGQSHFSCFFPGRKFPFWYTQNKFPDRKFPFWYTQNKFLLFSKVKSKKKKKKKSSPLFIIFPTSISNFPSSLLQFFFFSSLFSSQFSPLFPCLFFPRYVSKIFPVRSLGGTLPPCPLPVMPLMQDHFCNFSVE